MEFRRMSVTLFGMRVSALFILLANIVFIVADMRLWAIFGFAFSAYCFFPIGIVTEHITINNTGISCRTKKNLRWSYRWEEILELRTDIHSARIILKPELYKNNVKNQSTIADFELCKAAKKALALYCQCSIKYKNRYLKGGSPT